MDRIRNNSTYETPTPAVQQAVQDAQRLLSYAVQSRLSIEHDVVKTLTKAKNVLRQNAWTPEEEIEFWKAYTKLNAAVKPVTIRSLRAVSPASDSPSWLQFFTRARVFVFLYAMGFLGVVIGALFLLVYWVYGSHLIAEIDTLIEKRQEIFTIENAVRERTGTIEVPSQEVSTADDKVKEELKQLDKQLKANYDSLLNWSRYWQLLLPDEYTFEGKNVVRDEQRDREKISHLERSIQTDKRLLLNVEEEQYAAIQQRIDDKRREQHQLEKALKEEKILYQSILTKLPSGFVLEVLQSYILPLFFGLLGAAMYVLRSITNEIENVTYTIGSDIGYELRLTLGALGGLAIGWFLISGESSGLQAVSPLALAFLVGYNIELLFSVMDKFIESVSKEKSPSSEVQA